MRFFAPRSEVFKVLDRSAISRPQTLKGHYDKGYERKGAISGRVAEPDPLK